MDDLICIGYGKGKEKSAGTSKPMWPVTVERKCPDRRINLNGQQQRIKNMSVWTSKSGWHARMIYICMYG